MCLIKLKAQKSPVSFQLSKETLGKGMCDATDNNYNALTERQ